MNAFFKEADCISPSIKPKTPEKKSAKEPPLNTLSPFLNIQYPPTEPFSRKVAQALHVANLRLLTTTGKEKKREAASNRPTETGQVGFLLPPDWTAIPNQTGLCRCTNPTGKRGRALTVYVI